MSRYVDRDGSDGLDAYGNSFQGDIYHFQRVEVLPTMVSYYFPREDIPEIKRSGKWEGLGWYAPVKDKDGRSTTHYLFVAGLEIHVHEAWRLADEKGLGIPVYVDWKPRFMD